ncbi:MAG: hypothetical protein KBT06_04265 [Prevotellaceae bacterium]|nr:hypothetical protein [Candidatus Colivivens equi]
MYEEEYGDKAKNIYSQEKYDKLMKEYKPDGYSWAYSFSEIGNGILVCTSRSTHAAYLINTNEKEAVQLIDDNGRMIAFTLDDVDPKVIEMDVDSCNAENLIARYRFYVYDFHGGQAQVDWTVMPDVVGDVMMLATTASIRDQEDFALELKFDMVFSIS